MLNILSDNLIRIDFGSNSGKSVSLPELYSALMADRVEAFTALRHYQHHPWHAFLAQLGAMAMHRAGIDTPPETSVEWAGLLRVLTPEYPNDGPWQLVVDDITKPAFMQPPARSADKLTDYKNEVTTPDELDMLVTSKNHDLKASVAEQAGIDDWLFALLTLQTMEGFGGAGNYGISRMNGGLGSRPAFSLAPVGQKPGTHVRRDILALLEFRQQILDRHPGYPTNGGATLLWALPWDGTPSESLLLSRLDPFYIEVCRRIRLRLDVDGNLQGIRASSRAARIDGRDLKGRTGDPWTPANGSREGLPLTLSAGGFNYKRVAEYLTSADWEPPALMRPTQAECRSDDGMQLVARSMVRGQGKTEGYHQRIIPIGHKVKMAMLRRDSSQDLGDISKSRIEQISIVQRILSHAIQVFASRGDDDNVSPEHRELARPWLNRLEEIVDTHFFEDLQTEFEATPDRRQAIRNQWLMNGKDGVVDHARNVLHWAQDDVPCPIAYRYKARERTDSLFEGRLRSNGGLPFLFA